MAEASLATVLFRDGTKYKLEIHHYHGACLVGQPTAYVYRCGVLTWVKPGKSAPWVEAKKP